MIFDSEYKVPSQKPMTVEKKTEEAALSTGLALGPASGHSDPHERHANLNMFLRSVLGKCTSDYASNEVQGQAHEKAQRG